MILAKANHSFLTHISELFGEGGTIRIQIIRKQVTGTAIYQLDKNPQ